MHEFEGLRGLRDRPEGASCSSEFDCEFELTCDDGTCKEDNFFVNVIVYIIIAAVVFCVAVCLWVCYNYNRTESGSRRTESTGHVEVTQTSYQQAIPQQ